MGIDEEVFWTLTLREVDAYFRAFAWREKRRHEEIVAAGWWVERFAREKRLKPLRTYLEPEDAKSEDEHRAEQREVEAMARAMTGCDSGG